MDIRIDDLRGPAIAALLEEHLRGMRLHSPPGSVHALDLDRLRVPEITFWAAWDGDAVVGCGALKALGDDEGEIKSMRTASTHLRRGVGGAMLAQVLDEAKRRSYRRLYLETGSSAPFEPARRMYERAGFAYCGPFADYVADDFSVFMTKAL
jgi:putative acetyltransferase